MSEDSKHEAKETSEVINGIDDNGFSMINDYTLLRSIGKGSFGKVKLCEMSGRQLAVKIYQKSILRRKKEYFKNSEGKLSFKTAMDNVLQEIAIMKKLEHQNVLRLHEVIDDESDNKLYIVTDFCPNGPIMDWDEETSRFYFPWTDRLTEHQLRKCARDIVCGLEYLHSNHIVHRDIKPQNILLSDDWVVKIGDFGQSSVFSNNDLQRKTEGTYQFFAPEMCGSGQYSGKAADIWAMGLCFYLMVYHQLPFYSENISQLFEQICSVEPEFPEDVPIHPLLKHLILRLLDKNPDTRIKMWEIVQDPWLNLNCNPITASDCTQIEVTDQDLTNALNSVRSAIFAKRAAVKFRNRAKKHTQEREQL